MINKLLLAVEEIPPPRNIDPTTTFDEPSFLFSLCRLVELSFICLAIILLIIIIVQKINTKKFPKWAIVVSVISLLAIIAIEIFLRVSF